MKIEYMQPFVEAACSALERVCGQPTTAGTLRLMDATFPGASVNLAMRVRGSLCGDVLCSMSDATARRLAAKVSGADVAGFGRVLHEGLVAFSDAWSAQAARILAETGFACEVDAPIVFRGLNVELATAQPALITPVETPSGQTLISVAVSDGR